MIKVVIFDCFGVLVNDSDGSMNSSLLELISSLRQKGYKTAIVSNVGKGGLHRYFSNEELLDFDLAITSGDVGMVKPDPKIFLHVSEQLQIAPSDCLFIDDNEGHCNGAEAAGMQAIIYKNYEQVKADLEQVLHDTE